MRILYITPSFQHPLVRGNTRHYHFLRALSQRHAITLLTLARSRIPAEAYQEIDSYTERLYTFSASSDSGLAGGAGLNPLVGDNQLSRFLQLRSGVRQMKQTFTQLARQGGYDLLLFHGKDCFSVIEDFQDFPIVVDFCDATSMRVKSKMSYVGSVKRLLLRLRYRQVLQIEEKIVQKTPYLAFISSRDRQAILGQNNRAEVIPSGIDFQYWQRQTHNPQPNRLIFTGIMRYAPNDDAALYLVDKILPRLKSSFPEIEVFIVGRDPSPALRERASQHPEVTVTGFVDDMRPYYEQAAIFVAPLRYASGMQNKIQEALAMGVPIVTTSITAAGVCVDEAEEPPLYVADEPGEFTEKIIRLLSDQAERNRLAVQGRRFAEKHFDWARSARQLEQMCLDAYHEARRNV
ncbi:MAG TPA: glycosyltransferase [Anaerolineales bacterium]|nr:glycosyltransferase [Anaerolineales bacterium]